MLPIHQDLLLIIIRLDHPLAELLVQLTEIDLGHLLIILPGLHQEYPLLPAEDTIRVLREVVAIQGLPIDLILQEPVEVLLALLQEVILLQEALVQAPEAIHHREVPLLPLDLLVVDQEVPLLLVQEAVAEAHQDQVEVANFLDI